jgi:head-tail adaptor
VSLRNLLTQTVTVRPASDGTVDEYGDTSTVFAAGTTYRGRLEQRSAQEVTDGRDTFVSDWVLYLLPDAVINGRDRVEADGNTFEVVGAPIVQRSPRGPHHIQASLRLVA